ncbi:MAG: beta-galactosidase, partial [Oscillospiraceae bacterium]|nr:beta-galactosidase [Oscillospiraceae bacterium]
KFNEIEKHNVLSGHLNLGGKNPDSDEIPLNSKYLIRNGKPWMPIMGEIHFSRVKRGDWERELLKMKAGGITVVSTYLFWIYHEEIEGEYDFSGNRDIRAFIELCAKVGLEAVIRIGPWAHGECRNGGFPDWLLEKGIKLRDNNEEYMGYVRGWYGKIAEQTEGLFFKDGGPIIAVQLENELVDGAEHLAALKRLAQQLGIIAPLYTVTGWNSASGAEIPLDEVLPVFGGYSEAPWENHINKLDPSPHFFFNTIRNDSAIGTDLIEKKNSSDWQLPYERYPFATCELGGGIQVTHHRRPKISPMEPYAVSMLKLCGGNNLPGYYMYHGGTNAIGKLSTFNETRDSGYPNDYPILSYDFQAPIGEYGIVRRQCGLLNMLHLFVQDFGEIFAPMNTALGKAVDRFDTKSLRYAMRTDGKSGFVFVNHYQRITKLEDVRNVRFAVDDSLTFPEKGIDVKGEICFFMPFRMELGGVCLEYALSQPLCRFGNTYFFAEIPGIDAEYKIDGELIRDRDFVKDNIRIITLSLSEAEGLRRLDGELYIGDGCNLYLCGGKITAAEDGDFSYKKWNGNAFENHRVSTGYKKAEVRFFPVDKPSFEPKYYYELQMGGKRKVTWQRLVVSGNRGYIELPYTGDAAQLYADGELIADDYFYGDIWRVPASMLDGKEVYFGYSELLDDCYTEIEFQSGR